MANFCQKAGDEISNLIMSYGGEASFWTGQGVLNTKFSSAGTIGRAAGKGPAVSQCKSVSEVPLVKIEPMSFNGQSG